MTRFRPCIDLHAGQVKQIVGGTFAEKKTTTSTSTPSTDPSLKTNFVAALPSDHYARLYRDRGLHGAHVVLLGSDAANQAAARTALAAWPGGLQVGGGITADNAKGWIEAGASHVIVTSYLFEKEEKEEKKENYIFSQKRLDAVLAALDGDASKLVIDLSCRRVQSSSSSPQWAVAIHKWQTLTDMYLSAETLARLAPYCAEFLVHAADVEGLQRGIDADLVRCLAEWVAPLNRPVTYAGGAKTLEDLDKVKELSKEGGGIVDLTIGSALDCFGGSGVKLDDCIAWNEKQEAEEASKASKTTPSQASLQKANS